MIRVETYVVNHFHIHRMLNDQTLLLKRVKSHRLRTQVKLMFLNVFHVSDCIFPARKTIFNLHKVLKSMLRFLKFRHMKNFEHFRKKMDNFIS